MHSGPDTYAQGQNATDHECEGTAAIRFWYPSNGLGLIAVGGGVCDLGETCKEHNGACNE